MKKRFKLIYELFMFSLAILSVSFIWIQNESLQYIDKIVWFIFFVDVSIRFFKSNNKLEFIKKNPFDIIAIIPFDSVFQLARLARLIRVVRAFTIVKRYAKPALAILEINGLQRILTFTVILIFAAAIPIRFIEPSITTYEDALWWSVVTATTVGYGDISVETGLGRIIAIVLMVFGIGLLGMITGSIATYFIKETESDDPTTAYLKGQLDRLDELSKSELDAFIAILKSKKEHAEVVEELDE
ncbi:two pore domain potassium channel family protein [Sporosarcina sp. BI001-red]|uniref:potassium channel family protein n=1 Tax=Sporosarcina sp. BI001-red TaxID=2282866 RepID=UPI000E260E1C|nr:potassium channel family protein [Sporosarcina sp. BI001-red]REB07280.1 two pore domain potassium channel family protein [Sporosarcina sp. BI001-red]